MDLVVTSEGEVRCIYDETIDLHVLGALNIRRASHVEPTAGGHWIADLTPVRGPTLGPFDRRTDALAAEVAWLECHWLSDTPDSPDRRAGRSIHPHERTAS